MLLWFTPDLSRTGSFAVGWIAELYARNAVLIIVLYGTVHLRLYIRRAQDDRFKFSNRWPSTDNRTFMFRNQTRPLAPARPACPCTPARAVGVRDVRGNGYESGPSVLSLAHEITH